MATVYFEDIAVGTTASFGSYHVTEEEIIEFARKYDPQPFHVDPEAAKTSIFGALCASGWHTCSVTMRMLVDHMTATGVAGIASPGIDNIQWKKPVFAGDILSVKTEVLEKRELKSRPELGIIKSQFEVFNQKGEIVMAQQPNTLIAKRPPAKNT